MAEIAITLSGGGYRASMFHLGTLAYLHSLKTSDGKTLLDHIGTMTSISGGTLTALWYMMHYSNGATDAELDEAFKTLYLKLRDDDIMPFAVNNLFDRKNNSSSLIANMIKTYDEHFFHGAKFGPILDAVDSAGHLHHYFADGTDFSNGLPFRFQASRQMTRGIRGVIGNSENRIDWQMAHEIRLSEIMAVSSCFPGGFEPVAYPDDFAFAQTPEGKEYLAENPKSYQLMDGGIVDNQGIDPIELANSQMLTTLPKSERAGRKMHDLIIVSDVSSKHTSEYNVQPPFRLSKWFTLSHLDKALNVGLLLFGALIALAIWLDNMLLLGIFCAIEAELIVVRALTHKFKAWVKSFLSDLAQFSFDFKDVWKFPLKNIFTMCKVRLTSMYHMSDDIFFKPIKSLRYKILFQDSGWKNRLIASNIWELADVLGTWKGKVERGKLPREFEPSDAVMQYSQLASSMPTTLWFTQEMRDKRMPETLFAAGQMNICANLMEYIHSLKTDSSNTTDGHEIIKSVEEQLLADWRRFCDNPEWSIEKMLGEEK